MSIKQIARIALLVMIADYVGVRVVAAQVSAGVSPALLASRDSADAILQRYVDAIGGIANIARVHSRITKATMSLGRGISGTWQEEQALPDLAVERGSAHAWFGWSGEFGAGYDGHVAWEFTPSERPHVVAGRRGDAYQRQHRVDRDAHLDELYPTRAMLADRTVEGKRQHVVRMTPVSGFDETWYFDASNGLLSRIERTEDRGKGKAAQAVLTFDDYREVDGVRLPFRRGINNGDRPATIVVTSLVNNAMIEPAHFIRPPEVDGSKPPTS